MRFLRRAKIILHAEMNLHGSAFEPAPTALGKFGRLGNLNHAKNILVEPASHNFSARRHCQLDMIDGSEWRSERSGHRGEHILYRTKESDVRGPTSAFSPVRIKH